MFYYYNKLYKALICCIHTTMETNLKQVRNPIKKAHYVGTSIVVTIDQTHVKRLRIDDMTFFIQKPIENGIILELRKFNPN
jgi:hypothetical protein